MIRFQNIVWSWLIKSFCKTLSKTLSKTLRPQNFFPLGESQSLNNYMYLTWQFWQFLLGPSKNFLMSNGNAVDFLMFGGNFLNLSHVVTIVIHSTVYCLGVNFQVLIQEPPKRKKGPKIQRYSTVYCINCIICVLYNHNSILYSIYNVLKQSQVLGPT